MIKVSCPICGQQTEGQNLTELPYFPFCSKRCKLVDLGRWMDGTYSLPENEDESSDPQEKEVS